MSGQEFSNRVALVTGASAGAVVVHVAVLAGFAVVGFYVAVALVRRRFVV